MRAPDGNPTFGDLDRALAGIFFRGEMGTPMRERGGLDQPWLFS